MQLRRPARFLTVIGLTTKHVDCRITSIFVAYAFISNDDIFYSSENSVFSTIFILSHYKIQVPTSLVAKVILIRDYIYKLTQNVFDKIKKKKFF